MTVIAAFRTALGPVLFGDLMLSAPGPNPRIRLPMTGTVSDIVCPPSVNYPPVRLGPKVVVVAPTLALAWAGRYETADTVVSELVRLAADEPLRLDNIKAVIARATMKDTASTFMVCLSKENSVRGFTAGPVDDWTPRIHGLRQGWIAGSGRQLFRRQFDDGILNRFKDERQSAALFVKSLQAVMAKTELLMTRGTVGAGIGGGYDPRFRSIPPPRGSSFDRVSVVEA